MNYGSICSGVAPQTRAWAELGLECAWFSEIEAFPSAVLAHRFPKIPNLGDFTKIGAEHGAIDLLVGGTPCQAFSVAGLRAGLDDPRGNLTLEFARLAERLRPRWLVWENVPGVLSIDDGRTFGTFLGILGELGYGFAYRVLDAQHFGVPQRRRRVFVVGHLGDWRRAAAVLFERHSLSGHPAPRREKGKVSTDGIRDGIAGSIGAHRTGGWGMELDNSGAFIPEVVGTLSDGAHMGGGLNGQDAYTGRIIPHLVHALRADGFDASEDGTGRGTPLVPHFYQDSEFGAKEYDTAGTLRHGREPHHQLIAFSAKDHGADAMEHCSPTLRAGGFTESHANAGVMPAVCMNLRGRDGGAMPEIDELASVRAASGGSSRSYVAQMAVRRLTPRECERLQGMEDDWTLVPFRGKPASDGPRYKAIGNSWAVPVLTWIASRIVEVERQREN